MSSTLKPETAGQLQEAVEWAASEEKPLEVVGTGTKREVGRPSQHELTLDMSAFKGVTMYEPEELVLSARAATPRSEVEAKLKEKGQEFAFEPPDLSGLLGSGDSGTLGGMISSNLGGPRRIKSGAVRDHFLGFSAVSGRGETFKSGGRVVKNVTGYDLPKILAGSWGTLAVMSDVTLKVLPAAETESTLVLRGLGGESATQAMSAALQSSCEV
ncbi:MAG: FAD-binding protein, partial [Pseudomonadota bacterium]